MFFFKILLNNYFTYYAFILLEVKLVTIRYLKIWDHVNETN